MSRANGGGVTAEHYTVCRHSAPNRILNLDHIGTNLPDVPSEAFLEHWRILAAMARESGGYPVVSLLPDAYSTDVQKRFREEYNALWEEREKQYPIR